jgi:hypothetical protein
MNAEHYIRLVISLPLQAFGKLGDRLDGRRGKRGWLTGRKSFAEASLDTSKCS